MPLFRDGPLVFPDMGVDAANAALFSADSECARRESTGRACSGSCSVVGQVIFPKCAPGFQLDSK